MEQRAYQSGLVQQAGFQPKKRAKFDKQRDAANAQAQRNQAQQAQSIRDNNAVNEANVRQNGKDLDALAAFSSTLTEKLVEDKKKKNEEEMQRGMSMAFTEGVPQDEQDAFNVEEQELNNLNESTIKAANKIEGKTGNVFLGEKVRSMSGWAAYGYAMGKAQQGGQDYAVHMAQAAANTSVVVTNDAGVQQEITLETAKTPAEYAAVQAQIRSEFLKQYSGMNPALLNKYLFPSMREQEGKALLTFSKTRGEVIKNDRITAANDTFSAGLSGPDAGAALITYIRETSADAGGLGNARKKAVEVIKQGIKNGTISPEALDNLLDAEIEANDRSIQRVGTYWREFGNLKQELENEQVRDFTNDQNSKKMNAQKYAQNLRQQWSDNEERGEYLTEDQKDQLIKESMDEFGYVDDSLQNLRTQQDVGDENIEELLQNKMRNGQPITFADLRNASPELFRQYVGQIKKGGGPNALSTANQKRAEAEIKSVITEMTGEIDGMTEKTPKWNRMNNRAQDYFQLRYQDAAQLSENPQEAYASAMAQTQMAVKAGQFTEEYDAGLSVIHGAKVVRGLRTIEQWALDKEVPFGRLASTQVIPGTEEDIKALINYQENGINKIPPIYEQLSAGRRDMSAFDLARAQYKAFTGKDMVPPAAEQVTQEQSAEFQRLLKYRPTSARTRQAMVGSGDTRFLDLVASEESESYGGYDAYNLGGANGGETAYGSGNSLEDKRYGNPISQLTVGEIRKLQANGQLHAAGRYQFIRGTFAEVADELGLSNDTVFDSATQDRMAISRARWRVNNYGLSGLNNEWIGLRKVPQAQINAAYASIDPYNQPDVLTPGLRKLAYVTGNIGPTSTGEHLDVKDASGQRFSYRALDKYVEIDDPDYGTISLGDLREKTNFVGDSWDEHNARNSHGIDYGSASGSKVYVKNGATVVGSVPTEHGDKVTIQLPTGKQYTFLHGNSA